MLFSEYDSSTSINERGKQGISCILWGPLYSKIILGYIFTMLQNQLEDDTTILEDVYKSSILLQFLCIQMSNWVYVKTNFIPLVLANTPESVGNAFP